MANQIETPKHSGIAVQTIDPQCIKAAAEIAKVEQPAAGAKEARNFEKEVHSWNPTLRMWRRSNKE
jgi:hypothetical protein